MIAATEVLGMNHLPSNEASRFLCSRLRKCVFCESLFVDVELVELSRISNGVLLCVIICLFAKEI
jgi:hypothetical protein